MKFERHSSTLGQDSEPSYGFSKTAASIGDLVLDSKSQRRLSTNWGMEPGVFSIFFARSLGRSYGSL
jgi:hypothetical protein